MMPDEEELEPPVPAGLRRLPPAVRALAEFYEISDDLLQAAAERSSPLATKEADEQTGIGTWLAGQSRAMLQELLQKCLTGDVADVRAEVMAHVRQAAGIAVWPLTEPTRTYVELRQAEKAVEQQRQHREEQVRQAKRRKRLAELRADPKRTVGHVKRLVQQRSRDSYEEAAQELADLREALGPERGPKLAAAAAEALRQEHPTLRVLISCLRKQGF
jgi:hypothetical protein